MRPSPCCLPAASEVAPSCPPPQDLPGHPIPTPASRGTLRVPRSRSSRKQLSSTRPSRYGQLSEGGQGGHGQLEAGAGGVSCWGVGAGGRPGGPGWVRDLGVGVIWPRAQPVSSACLCLPPHVFMYPVTRLAATLCRAVSQAPALEVKLSRSDPALSSCWGEEGGRTGGGGGGGGERGEGGTPHHSSVISLGRELCTWIRILCHLNAE